MRHLAIALVAAAVLFASPLPALACKCVGPSYAKAVKQSDAIFSGKLIAIKKGERKRGQRDEFVFVVKRIYKGNAGLTQSIHSTVSSCGLVTGGLRVGKSYLVYARSDGKQLTSRQCRRTARLDGQQARADIVRLGKGRAPR